MTAIFPASRPLRRLAAILVAAAAVVGPAAALAQSGDSGRLQDRLERLERDLRTLQHEVYRGEAPGDGAQAESGDDGGDGISRPLAARLDVRISDLESTQRELTGRLETLAHRMEALDKRLGNLVADVDERLRALERGRPGPGQAAAGRGPEQAAAAEGEETTAGSLGTLPRKDLEAFQSGELPTRVPTAGDEEQAPASPAGGEAAAPAPVPQAAPAPAAGGVEADVSGGPEAEYDHAFSLLRRGDYRAARQALDAFLEQRPEHALAGNAKYWLGETYYVTGQYDAAAVHFLEGYQNYPDSPKAADNLLKLGMTLAALDKSDQACTVLERLGDEFPDAPAHIRRRAETEAREAGCS